MRFMNLVLSVAATPAMSAATMNRKSVKTASNMLNTTTVGPHSDDNIPPFVIPVESMECGYSTVDLDFNEIRDAKEKFIAWSDAGNEINAQQYWWSTTGGATWYVCNCKWFWRDRVPRKELDQVEYMLEDGCGQMGGWVWSQEWNKRYNLVNTPWFEEIQNSGEEINLCPKGCLGYW